MAYDSASDRLLVYKDQLWAYNPATNAWSELNSAQSPPRAVGRVHGNFKFDPSRNVTFLVTPNDSYHVETWAYRFKDDGTVPVVAPNSPVALWAD